MSKATITISGPETSVTEAIEYVQDKLTKLQADEKRVDGLRALMGCVEAGEDTVVTLFQDDATKSYFVKVGNRSYFGNSFRQAIDAAMKAENERNS